MTAAQHANPVAPTPSPNPVIKAALIAGTTIALTLVTGRAAMGTPQYVSTNATHHAPNAIQVEHPAIDNADGSAQYVSKSNACRSYHPPPKTAVRRIKGYSVRGVGQHGVKLYTNNNAVGTLQAPPPVAGGQLPEIHLANKICPIGNGLKKLTYRPVVHPYCGQYFRGFGPVLAVLALRRSCQCAGAKCQLDVALCTKPNFAGASNAS